MKFDLRILVFISIYFVLLSSCNQKKSIQINDADILHQNQDELTQIIIYDVFSPPVASRIYAYTSLASYEAIRFANPRSVSIAEQLKGFSKMPQPEKNKKYNYTLAASKAFFTVARKVVFSVDSLNNYENNLYAQFKNVLDDSTYNRSIAFGDTIGKAILARANVDNYPQTRGKPKYLGTGDPTKWRPTPPDYMDAIEYCWGTMKAFVLDSSSEFVPPPPPKFSTDTNSEFCKGVMQVYNINKNLTQQQKDIARYWDDNPFVVEHSGHMMFGDKKITPGGHWMGIAAIACKQSNADAVKTAQTYALTAIALFEGFISCWDEKYKVDYIRPVTVIDEQFDNTWLPYLQTPPFPEYPSGHSVISASAATILTHLFGNNFKFQDTSDLEYIGIQRHFNSFFEASNEASISRVYGGIHYLNTVNKSAEQGRQVGNFIIQKLKL
ncbi:MAG: vanadium-dependent haloperoxidase [Chitinophagaceae bacterium]